MQKTKQRGRPPLSERDKAYRVCARLHHQLQVLVEQQAAEPTPEEKRRPGRPRTPIGMLINKTRRECSQAMIVLHAWESEEGMPLTREEGLKLPQYPDGRRPGRPALSEVEKIANAIAVERDAIDRLTREVAANKSMPQMTEQRRGRPPVAAEEKIATHRKALGDLQKSLIKARAAERRQRAEQALVERRREAAKEEIRRKMAQLRQILAVIEREA